MGAYLNPGKAAYEEAVHSEIFIDKSEMLQYLNSVVKTKQKYVSVSRPRRFGKTMAADMICAYYDREANSQCLFRDRLLAKTAPVPMENGRIEWDAYLGKFDVIRVVMTRFFKKGVSVDKSLANMQILIIRDLKKKYPDVEFFDETDLLQAIEDVYSSNGLQVVIVIDEWDAVFRTRQNDKKGQTEYLDFLRDLLKDNTHIALAYMTGILPIKKYGEHSALNMFDEYSMTQPMRLAEYTGFTEKEVKDLCDEYKMDYQKISDWYDGYRVTDYIPVNKRSDFRRGAYSDHKLSIYSPLSVVSAMRNGIVDNYWNKTENYEALADFIKLDYDGLKDTIALLMDGARVRVNLKGYQNDMTSFRNRNDILALLIHLGYLGFEGDESEGRIDSEQGEIFIPNREILEEFKTSTESDEWIGTFEQFRTSQELLQATLNEDENRVAELIEKAHNQAANKTYNDESALSYGVQLAYYAAQKYYTSILELDSGKGYADVVYLPRPGVHMPALLVELKYNQEADTALNQILRQEYPDRLIHYQGNILLVGINYNRETRNDDPLYKHHTCRIVRA
ncbi:MAG: AAA family ATPase [Clostridia bacterium]|nr:AAA family ATPase [Clostridia bacterium]